MSEFTMQELQFSNKQWQDLMRELGNCLENEKKTNRAEPEL